MYTSQVLNHPDTMAQKVRLDPDDMWKVTKARQFTRGSQSRINLDRGRE